MSDDRVTKALLEGARRSRQASGLQVREPLPLELWRRRKWWIIGAGLLLLEYLVMSALGGAFGRHF